MSLKFERIALHHIEGPRVGHVDVYAQPVVAIGRAVDCHLCFFSEKGVSGHHCEIRQSQGQFELVDLNSTNGTFIGEDRITRHLLVHGDFIRLGWLGPLVRVELEHIDTTQPNLPLLPITQMRSTPNKAKMALEDTPITNRRPEPQQTPSLSMKWLWLALGVLVLLFFVSGYWLYF